MEREVNVYRDNLIQAAAPSSSAKQFKKSSISRIGLDEKNYDMLARQVNLLMICYDIYLESESAYLQNFEHRRVKLWQTSVK